MGLLGTVPLSGCLRSSPSGPEPGSLTLENRHDRAHSVEVELSKGGASKRDVFDLVDGEERTVTGYVPFTGRYTFTATLDPGPSDTPIPLLETSRDGNQSLSLESLLETPTEPSGDRRGHALRASIGEDGVLTVSMETPEV
jgi:hypothetical protein